MKRQFERLKAHQTPLPKHAKWVDGYVGRYAIDRDGNVWSASYRQTGEWGCVSPGDSCGYKIVGLYANGKRKNAYIHRLVASAFIENPSMCSEVNHKNFDRSDNRVENLEWVTPESNADWTVKGGRHTAGERNGRHKLNMDDVIAIRLFKQLTNVPCGVIAKRYGVCVNTVQNVVSGRSWRTGQ